MALEDYLSSTDKKEKPKEEIRAKNTTPGSNRFTVNLYLRVMANGTLRPVKRRDLSKYTIKLLCEYPTYEEELDCKKNATKFDDLRSIHFIDQDQISEWRVQRCLVQWDMHKKIPHFTHKLSRTGILLSASSWQTVKSLPPPVRKSIFLLIWKVIEPPY